MSTPLLPELVLEIDANLVSYSGGGVEMYHNYLWFRVFAKYGECSKFATAIGHQKLKGFQLQEDQMHHKFGSRQLIDDLHSLGHAASYSELRGS